jgi:hypothetical protein
MDRHPFSCHAMASLVAFATIDASAKGIEQIMWIMRPSKLAAISTARLTIDRSTP